MRHAPIARTANLRPLAAVPGIGHGTAARRPARARRRLAAVPRGLAAVALLAFLVLALAGCSGTSDPGPGASQTDGTPLLEFLGSQDAPDAGGFADLDPAQVTRIVYCRDQFEDVQTTDPAQIAQIVDGLGQIQVTGPYLGDEYATDSAETLTIDRKDSDALVVRFDFGKLVLGDAYYDLANKQALTSALRPLEKD